MQHNRRDILLDVTRLVSRSWTGRQSTGIDRVCYAYLRHYRDRSLAVIQHRGVVRVLGPRRSETLFRMLLGPSKGFRAKFTAWAPAALFGVSQPRGLHGLTYINVSHTDFDLPEHFDWVRVNKLRSIYFVHDLIPVRCPQLSRPHAVARHTGRVRSALCNADQIIVASQTVADDLSAYANAENLPAPPIAVSHISGERFSPIKHSAKQSPFFLCVGTIEPRKNHRLLLDVWNKLTSDMGRSAPQLLIVGQPGPRTGEILAAAASQPNIEFLGHCSDEELAVLMNDCTALLMPSQAEGFGLPVVEALELGTNVIASDSAIFREITQGMAQLIDPVDVDAWSHAIARLAREHRSGAWNGAAKTERAKRFSPPTWDAHFAKVDRAILAHSAAATLKSDAACESSLAA